MASRQVQPEFIVSVASIKKQIQVVKKKLVQLEKKNPDAKSDIDAELRVLRKVWDALGNLTF